MIDRQDKDRIYYVNNRCELICADVNGFLDGKNDGVQDEEYKGPTDADIIYDLHQVDGKWMVWDVTTDEVSLVRNYKGQFNRIISEQGGFDELMRKMKKKLAEKE